MIIIGGTLNLKDILEIKHTVHNAIKLSAVIIVNKKWNYAVATGNSWQLLQSAIKQAVYWVLLNNETAIKLVTAVKI